VNIKANEGYKITKKKKNTRNIPTPTSNLSGV